MQQMQIHFNQGPQPPKKHSTIVKQRKERLILIVWQTHRGVVMSSIIGTADFVQYSTVIINYKSYQNKRRPRGWMTWG